RRSDQAGVGAGRLRHWWGKQSGRLPAGKLPSPFRLPFPLPNARSVPAYSLLRRWTRAALQLLTDSGEQVFLFGGDLAEAENAARGRRYGRTIGQEIALADLTLLWRARLQDCADDPQRPVELLDRRRHGEPRGELQIGWRAFVDAPCS